MGIYRWLFRQSMYADGGRQAMKRSERTKGPTLLSKGSMVGSPVKNVEVDRNGTVADAMLSREANSFVW